jgi:REP-associated tyrosine transposase
VARAPRSDLQDAIYHVVNRGVDHSAIYRDDVDRKTFLTLLGSAVRRCGWTCHAYCLMTTHYHLVVETDRPGLSRGMHLLNGGYAQAFNERHLRPGHLFGGRYSVYVIDREEHLEASCEYVLENPVRAGLCRTVEEWAWSGRPALAA